MNWIPSIEKQTAKGTREIALRTHHLTENRKIYLTGPIDEEAATAFEMQLSYAEAIWEKEAQDQEPYTVIISSPGGEVNAGLMIYDLIQSAKIPLRLVCAGMAASMAAIILAGGKKWQRFILPNSRVMIHEPLIAGEVGGSASSISKTAEDVMAVKKICNSILARHTGKTIEEIDKATRYDNVLTALEAVEFGIVDQIITHI